jgi:hypothetical protein
MTVLRARNGTNWQARGTWWDRRLLGCGRMRAAVLVIVAACAYRPGSFARYGQRFDGEPVTVGCLDLAIERRADLTNAPVLGYQFGNRCARSAVVDLASAHVVGRTGDGRELALAPYDPKHEIRALRVDGRWTGNEALAYPSDVAIAQVCVDAASIAHEPTARWICL